MGSLVAFNTTGNRAHVLLVSQQRIQLLVVAKARLHHANLAQIEIDFSRGVAGNEETAIPGQQENSDIIAKITIFWL